MNQACNTCIFGPKNNMSFKHCRVQDELVRFYNGCPKHIALEFDVSQGGTDPMKAMTDEALFYELSQRGYNFDIEGEE